MPDDPAAFPDAPDLAAKDDGFHLDAMGDRWRMTETAWFSFRARERKPGGWLYAMFRHAMFRPDIGMHSGGVRVRDDSAPIPWETRCGRDDTAMPPPDGDLTDATLRTGETIKAPAPLTRCKPGFEAEDGRLSVDLDDYAVMAPRARRKPDSSFKNLAQFDRFGRVTGHIALVGEPIPIDRHAMRDRSRGPRPEHRPGRGANVSGIASPEDRFLRKARAEGLA